MRVGVLFFLAETVTLTAKVTVSAVKQMKLIVVMYL